MLGMVLISYHMSFINYTWYNWFNILSTQVYCAISKTQHNTTSKSSKPVSSSSDYGPTISVIQKCSYRYIHPLITDSWSSKSEHLNREYRLITLNIYKQSALTVSLLNYNLHTTLHSHTYNTYCPMYTLTMYLTY